MTTRRAFLASSVAVLGALAGCTGQSDLTTTHNGATATTMESTSTPASTTITTTDREPATTGTTRTTRSSPYDPPKLNRTSYPVTWQWDLRSFALGEDRTNEALLTTDEWREKINEDLLSAESLSFLSETDFDAASVVAVQAAVAAGYNRLILHSVDGVGTDTIVLTISEWESGSGMNDGPIHLLLVRVPNRGTGPTEVEVTSPQTTTEG